MRTKCNLVSEVQKVNVYNISSKKKRQPSGIQILLQYIVNKAGGGAKAIRTEAIGCCSRSIMHKEKMSGYIPVRI